MSRLRSRENPLSRWIDGVGLKRLEFAVKVGISRVYLDQLCRDEKRASLKVAFAIQRETNGAVPAAYWEKFQLPAA